jgi:hypothetical protein
MNTLEERKYRFTEIVTAITLLPRLSEIDDVPTLPNYTIGLSNHNLRSALISQALREGEDFSNKLVNALIGSAITSINENDNDKIPTQDDMSAIGLAMSLAWSHQELPYFLSLSGLLASIWEKNHDRVDECDYLLPSEVVTILTAPKGVLEFSKFEPYDLLDDSSDKVAKQLTHLVEENNLPEDIKSAILKAINKELSGDE